jgi:hypothetical protein
MGGKDPGDDDWRVSAPEPRLQIMPCIASFLSISDPTASPRLFNPIASYTMGTDPTALGGNARGDV